MTSTPAARRKTRSEKPPSDLLEALRESVAQHSTNGKRRNRTQGHPELADLTKRELVARQRNARSTDTRR